MIREKLEEFWAYNGYVITDIMTILGPALFFILVAILSSCSTMREVPVEYIEKIEYRDSLVYVHDTVDIQVPIEVVKEVLPDIDTSYLETSVASSIAYLDTSKRELHHELAQKGHFKAVLDTLIVVELLIG